MLEDSNIFLAMPELIYVTPQATNIRRVQRPLHQHRDVAELLFVYQGEGVCICDGYSCDIHPGDFLLMNQNSMHEVQSATELEIGTFCFGISGLQLAGRQPGWLTSSKEGFVRYAGEDRLVANELCRVIYRQMDESNHLSHLTAQYLFVGLLLLALRCPADERSETIHQNKNVVLATRIHQYITLHYTEPLTIQSIVETLHISQSYASHIFKEQYHMSPIQFMINCRIGEAQNLLISSDYSAAQIGTMVGYDSINHFNTIFKQKVGMPPIQYRKYYLEQMRGKRKQ